MSLKTRGQGFDSERILYSLNNIRLLALYIYIYIYIVRSVVNIKLQITKFLITVNHYLYGVNF